MVAPETSIRKPEAHAQETSTLVNRENVDELRKAIKSLAEEVEAHESIQSPLLADLRNTSLMVRTVKAALHKLEEPMSGQAASRLETRINAEMLPEIDTAIRAILKSPVGRLEQETQRAFARFAAKILGEPEPDLGGDEPAFNEPSLEPPADVL